MGRGSPSDPRLRRLGDVASVVAVLRHSLSDREVAALLSVPRREVACGFWDWLVPWRNSEILSRLLRCPLLLSESGHFLQLEAPEEWNARLVSWCCEVR